MFKQFLFLLFIFLITAKNSAKASDKIYVSANITIEKVRDNVYRHVSFLQSETFGKVSCNGMIVFDKGEAIIFDTPVSDSISAELIDWVTGNLKCKIIAIIPTHFHEDCLGGLEEFHRRGIRSYAENRTIKSAKLRKFPVPQIGFDNKLEMKAGNKEVITEFFGEGHTKDNVVGYFPEQKVMFGGCLIKEVDAGKGNLADANVDTWSATVTKLKTKYPDAQVVIPGHGKSGSTELLDYTIKLFANK